MLITLILILGNLAYAYADCGDTPAHFLPHGDGVGDEELVLSDDGSLAHTFSQSGWPIFSFGRAQTVNSIKITRAGKMLFKKPNGSPILHITPRNIQVNPRPCGSLHLRHSTSSSDLQAMDKILCGPYDGVFVATFVCAGAKTPSCDMSLRNTFQVVIATNGTRTIVVIQYDDPTLPGARSLGPRGAVHPLDEDDIADDGQTITDITERDTTPDGDSLPVVQSDNCVIGDIELCSVADVTSCGSPTVAPGSTCSKPIGVGLVLLVYSCDVTLWCYGPCCCEKFPAGPAAMIPGLAYCTKDEVINWGFGADSQSNKATYCPDT